MAQQTLTILASLEIQIQYDDKQFTPKRLEQITKSGLRCNDDKVTMHMIEGVFHFTTKAHSIDVIEQKDLEQSVPMGDDHHHDKITKTK